MSLTIDELFEIATPDAFVTKIKDIAVGVGLTPATWLASGITNTIIGAVGAIYGLASGITFSSTLTEVPFDAIAAVIARSGFLDTAAGVTPDAGISWLDLLGDSFYDVQRTGAAKASGPVTLANTGVARGPFAPGAYHLVNASLKKTYSNTGIFSIAAAANTTTNFAADEAGSASTTVANVLTPLTSFVGVTVKTSGGANTNTLVGADAQSNSSLVDKCRGKLQSLGPKLGPEGAYIYFAMNQDVAGYPALSGGRITRAIAVLNTYSGAVNIYLATASGPALAGDVVLILTYLTSVVKPDAVQISTFAADAKNVAIALTVYVPAANVATAVADVQVAIASYFSSLPFGGTTGDIQGLQRSAISAAVFAAVPYVENVTALTLNSLSADIVLTPTQIAVSTPPPVVTVIAT